jgi:hypothetical protein
MQHKNSTTRSARRPPPDDLLNSAPESNLDSNTASEEEEEEDEVEGMMGEVCSDDVALGGLHSTVCRDCLAGPSCSKAKS